MTWTGRIAVASLLAWLALPGQVAIRSSRVPPLRLGIQGARFTVDGSPRFLTLVSYFDAMDAVALDEDLAVLARSADGVRIFANWWDPGKGRCRFRFSKRTLFERRSDGGIGLRAGRLERLQQVLTRARSHGLVVDLTFAVDPVAGASRLSADATGLVCPPPGFDNVADWTGIAAALAETARALAVPAYAHVFFDLQNEAGHSYNRATEADLRLLVEAVRRADSSRLISVSLNSPDADRHARLVKTLGLSLLNFHDMPRSAGWGRRTGAHVARFRDALTRLGLDVPIYAGEPDPGAYGADLQEFRDSLSGARTAGAGAWTFHTRVAYDLLTTPLGQRLDPLTRRVLEALPAWQGR